MHLGKQTDSVLRGFEPWEQFRWLLALTMLISGWFAISVTPFLRRDYGERYLSWINLFFGYTIVANFTFLGGLLGGAIGAASPWAMTLFWLAFIGLSAFHRFEIWRKNRNGIEWHSQYMGTSLIPAPFSAEAIAKWIEPMAVLVAGLFMWKLASAVGLWLIISAFSLLMHNHVVYFFERQRFLDLRDARIEARNMSGALEGKNPHRTGGFTIAESNLQILRQDLGLKSAMAALGRDLKSMLDVPEAPTAERAAS